MAEKNNESTKPPHTFKVPKTNSKPTKTPSASKLEAVDENISLYTGADDDPLAQNKAGIYIF